jgi:hypothetical protein
MEASSKFTSDEIDWVMQISSQIVQKHAPEEADLVTIVVERHFHRVKQEIQTEEDTEQIFAFSGSGDLQNLFSQALVWILSLVVIPFLLKAYEKAIEKSAEKTIDVITSKLHDLLGRLKQDNKDQALLQQWDLLIPIDWMELNRQIKATGKDQGLSAREAEKIASLTIKELSQDRILVGDLLLHVKRIGIPPKN